MAKVFLLLAVFVCLFFSAVQAQPGKSKDEPMNKFPWERVEKEMKGSQTNTDERSSNEINPTLWDNNRYSCLEPFDLNKIFRNRYYTRSIHACNIPTHINFMENINFIKYHRMQVQLPMNID